MFAMCVKDVSLTLNMTKARAQLFRIIVIPSAARDPSASLVVTYDRRNALVVPRRAEESVASLRSTLQTPSRQKCTFTVTN